VVPRIRAAADDLDLTSYYKAALMNRALQDRIFAAIDSIILIDPHTHIDPHSPASTSLADILGYHYYTELAHSAGLPKSAIENPELSDRDRVAALVPSLAALENTTQYSWFIELAREFFDFQENRITPDNWESLYDIAEEKMSSTSWADEVLAKSGVESVFLTSDFHDPLEGFDVTRYIPCLRTDELVFHWSRPEVGDRLANCTQMSIDSAADLREAIAERFEHFRSRGARAVAISLPPDFAPRAVSLTRADSAFSAVTRDQGEVSLEHRRALSNFTFWTLAEYCQEFGLPFDLMIGVNRSVYENGVHQGRDLYDSRVSLIQYRELFNAFPRVKFPVSVLASVTNQELASYAWIFPNVVTHGHWWYSNTPSIIESDLTARIEAVPRNKQIGYYSDMYKLEFALPKFRMYKRVLSKVLAEQYVIDRGWTEERAIELAHQILRGNVEEIFFKPT
jgi:glucuronate isomerase